MHYQQLLTILSILISYSCKYLAVRIVQLHQWSRYHPKCKTAVSVRTTLLIHHDIMGVPAYKLLTRAVCLIAEDYRSPLTLQHRADPIRSVLVLNWKALRTARQVLDHSS